MKRPFSKFGMEPTYFTSVLRNVPQSWHRVNTWGCSMWEDAMSGAVDNIRNKRLQHSWWKNATNDENVLEIPSTTYKSYSLFKKDLASLERKLKEYAFVRSSVVCLEEQGGCHINFSLARLPNNKNYMSVETLVPASYVRRVHWWEDLETPSEKRIKGEKMLSYRTVFFKNLVTFLADNPALVWSCLAPNDNVSSCLPSEAYEEDLLKMIFRKGDFLTVRRNDGGMWDPSNKAIPCYVELRMFMMPRCDREMDFHFNLANNIMRYIKSLTDNKVYLRTKKTAKVLKNYTLEKAKKELREAFQTLGVSYTDWVDLGKYELLAERFSNGKSYLV